MTTYNTATDDQHRRLINPVLCNTAKDGSGTWYFALVDSDGHLQVDALSIAAGATRMGIVLEDPHEVRLAKAIGAAAGYTAEDVVNDSTCCTTATAWLFLLMSNATGGYGVIDFATIFSETRNIEPRLTLDLYNAVPTCNLMDNVNSSSPLPADRTKWIGQINFPALDKVSAQVASTSLTSGSTVGGLPIRYKCASGSTTIYGVLKTLDDFTQVATEDIEITLQIRHL